MEQNISFDFLKNAEEKFDSDSKNLLAMNAVVAGGVANAALSFDAKRNMRHTFSIDIKNGKVTNQKQSGRCWMFASLNTMRFHVMKKLNLENFELSQAYPLFYDKLEKSNYFLESILKTLDEKTDSRLISYLLSGPLGDGGQWDMFAALTDKYGVVPKDAMPESVSSSATREITGYLTEKLREYACRIREAHENGKSLEDLHSMKDGYMEEIYRMLCIAFGKPPVSFTFEVEDKDGNFIRDENITPKEFFAKYVDIKLDDYVSLINAPTKDKPYNRTYTVKFLGNVIEGRPVKYLNLTSEELKNAAIAQMKDGLPVWFGCDVGKRSTRDSGIMDLDSVNVENLFSTTFSMNKAERLDYGQSLMTHAMVFLGVNLDENGKPNRWKVENSWGKDAGDNGYYVMSDKWFDEYNYQIVVDKKYLTEEQRALLEQAPIELEPWDPMGSLAITE